LCSRNGLFRHSSWKSWLEILVNIVSAHTGNSVFSPDVKNSAALTLSIVWIVTMMSAAYIKSVLMNTQRWILEFYHSHGNPAPSPFFVPYQTNEASWGNCLPVKMFPLPDKDHLYKLVTTVQ
jgi:hypothetical protein